MIAIVAKNKPGHVLVPQFGGLIFLTKFIQRTLICLHCSLCKKNYMLLVDWVQFFYGQSDLTSTTHRI